MNNQEEKKVIVKTVIKEDAIKEIADEFLEFKAKITKINKELKDVQGQKKIAESFLGGYVKEKGPFIYKEKKFQWVGEEITRILETKWDYDALIATLMKRPKGADFLAQFKKEIINEKVKKAHLSVVKVKKGKDNNGNG